MGPGMLFALLDEVDPANRSFAHECLGPDILGCETEFLRIHQLDPGLAAGRNHPVSLVKVHAKRLFNDHMLPGGSTVNDKSGMKVIGYADQDYIHLGQFDRLTIVGKEFWYAEFLSERP